MPDRRTGKDEIGGTAIAWQLHLSYTIIFNRTHQQQADLAVFLLPFCSAVWQPFPTFPLLKALTALILAFF